MSTDTWINKNGGNWAVATDWSLGGPPANGNDVVVDVTPFASSRTGKPNYFAVIYNNKAIAALNSLTSVSLSPTKGHPYTRGLYLLLERGGITIATSSSMSEGTLSISNGATFGGTGTLTLSDGTLTTDNATFIGTGGIVLSGIYSRGASFAGTNRFSNGYTITAAGSSITGATAILTGDGILNAGIGWSNAVITLTNGFTVNAAKFVGITSVNMELDNGAQITFNLGSTVGLASDTIQDQSVSFYGATATGTMINDGNLRVTGPVVIADNFVNNGTVTVFDTYQGLSITDTATGIVDLGSYAGAGILSFQTVFGPEDFIPANPTVSRTIDGTVTVGTLMNNGDALEFKSNVAVTSAVFQGGSYDPYNSYDYGYIDQSTFDAGYSAQTTSLSAGATVVFSQGGTTAQLTATETFLQLTNGSSGQTFTSAALMINNGNFTVTNTGTLTGLAIEGTGTFTNGGSLTMSDGIYVAASQSFDNKGTLDVGNVIANYATQTFSGTFINEAGATIDITSDATPLGNGPVLFNGASPFQNAGTFIEDGSNNPLYGGTGETEVDSVFNNTGSLIVEAGTLWLKGGLTGNGSVIVSPGAHLLIGPSQTPFAALVHAAAATPSSGSGAGGITNTGTSVHAYSTTPNSLIAAAHG